MLIGSQLMPPKYSTANISAHGVQVRALSASALETQWGGTQKRAICTALLPQSFYVVLGLFESFAGLRATFLDGEDQVPTLQDVDDSPISCFCLQQ